MKGGTLHSFLLEGKGTLAEDVLVSQAHISVAWAGLTAPVKVIQRCQAALSLSSELASSLTTGSPRRRRALLQFMQGTKKFCSVTHSSSLAPFKHLTHSYSFYLNKNTQDAFDFAASLKFLIMQGCGGNVPEHPHF